MSFFYNTHFLGAARGCSLGVEEKDYGVLTLEVTQGKRLALVGPTLQY